MSENLQRISPLIAFQAVAAQVPRLGRARVYLTERPFLGYLNLRGDPNNPEFVNGTQRCLGLSLPMSPNTLSESEKVTALWLSPDEWLLVTQCSKEGELTCALRDALRNLTVAITELTDGQTNLHLCGPNAIDVLQKGCSVDLHPQSFGLTCCAQTLVAKVPVLIYRVDRLHGFALIVRRSFAEYLALWLQDAASEYGFAMISSDREAASRAL